MKAEIEHPRCPMHGEPLELKQDSQGLWFCFCKHLACAKVGYAWSQHGAYLEFHRANNIKPC